MRSKTTMVEGVNAVETWSPSYATLTRHNKGRKNCSWLQMLQVHYFITHDHAYYLLSNQMKVILLRLFSQLLKIHPIGLACACGILC